MKIFFSIWCLSFYITMSFSYVLTRLVTQEWCWKWSTTWCCLWWCMCAREHLWPQINSTLTLSQSEASMPLKLWPSVPSCHHRGSAVAVLASELCKMPHCVPSSLLCAMLNNVPSTSPSSHAWFWGLSTTGAVVSSLSVIPERSLTTSCR